MDFMQRTVQLFFDGGRAVFADLSVLAEDVRSMRFDHFDTENVSLYLLMAVVAGLIALIAYAQLNGPDLNMPVKDTINAALGTSSGVVRRPGDPPIPPPSEVVALRIYPIKSCRGIEIDATRLCKTGLTLDRNWMFVDMEKHNFLTIRSDPSMTLIDTKIIQGSAEQLKELDMDGDKQLLEVSIHGTDGRILVPAFPTQKWLKAHTKLSTVEIWEKDTDGWEYGEEINKIFCDFFNKPVALIYKGPTHRNVAVNGSVDKYGKEQNHNFADVMSLQVASEASMKDLNRRLKEKNEQADLTIERFRPNIIIKGRDDHPWEEDQWKRVRITTRLPHEEALYKIDLDIVARCARCQVPNVNPDTAEKHAKEPWDELMKFRRVDTGGVAKYKPCFGMLAIPRNEGMIQVGSTLEVLETTSKHLYNTARFADL